MVLVPPSAACVWCSAQCNSHSLKLGNRQAFTFLVYSSANIPPHSMQKFCRISCPKPVENRTSHSRSKTEATEQKPSVLMFAETQLLLPCKLIQLLVFIYQRCHS